MLPQILLQCCGKNNLVMYNYDKIFCQNCGTTSAGKYHTGSNEVVVQLITESLTGLDRSGDPNWFTLIIIIILYIPASFYPDIYVVVGHSRYYMNTDNLGGGGKIIAYR